MEPDADRAKADGLAEAVKATGTPLEPLSPKKAAELQSGTLTCSSEYVPPSAADSAGHAGVALTRMGAV